MQSEPRSYAISSSAHLKAWSVLAQQLEIAVAAELTGSVDIAAALVYIKRARHISDTSAEHTAFIHTVVAIGLANRADFCRLG